MKRLLIGISCLLLYQWVFPQNNKETDSLQLVLQSRTLSITKKIILLNNLSHKLLESDPGKAQKCAQTALDLSSKADNNELKALSCINIGAALYKRNVLDSARNFCMESAKIYQKIKDTAHLDYVYKELGNIEADMGNFEQSLRYYQISLEIYEKEGDQHNVASIYCNIGALYINLRDLDRMYEYTSKALKLFRQEGNKMGIAACQTNLTEYYFSHNDTANIVLALNEAIQLFHQTNARINESNALKSLADYYSQFVQDQDKALVYYKRAEILLNEGDNNDLRMDNYRNVSLAYYRKQDYKNSLVYAKKASGITDTNNIPYMQLNYYLLTYVYMGLRDFPNGEHAFDKYVELTNKVYEERQIKSIAEMEVKYQTEKKEKEILKLTTAKKLRSIMIFSLLILFIIGIILVFYIYRNIRQKKIIAEQKVSELIKSQQLMATQSVLSGEENERRRLARELHDGLGGLLSGVKFKLNNLKNNFVLNDETAQEFNLALNTLDNSVQELRRVAHNMMPETLVKFGLKDAVNDFSSSITNKTCEIVFQFYGVAERLPQNLEIGCYRIVQELVNNALKHSGAKKIVVQLIQESSRISLIVQDNGIGFDLANILESRGLGLNSIKSRVTSLNGIIDINTSPGKGTEIEVEFPV